MKKARIRKGMVKKMSGLKDLSKGRRAPHRARKIVLGILAGILVICGVLVAVNLNTILLLFGKGSIKLQKLDDIKSAASATGLFTTSESSDSSGNKTLSGVSKDGAIKFTVTQSKDGSKTLNAQVDTNKLDTSTVDVDALKSGNLSGLGSLKSEADKYLGSFVDSSQVTGIEAYVAKEAYAQYKSNKDTINVSKSFDGGTLNVTANLKNGTANIDLKQ